jgi:hypothetical protein
MAVDVPDMVAKFMESHEDIDTVLMGMCYALLRMRPLSISCAEGCVVVSCGKDDYDKSGRQRLTPDVTTVCIFIYIHTYYLI